MNIVLGNINSEHWQKSWLRIQWLKILHKDSPLAKLDTAMIDPFLAALHLLLATPLLLPVVERIKWS